MRILVTGGNGFLGSRITRMLLDEGHGVTCLMRSKASELEAIGAQTCQADIRDKARIVPVVNGHDAVIHTAAKAGAWGPASEYESINVDGTRNLLEACRETGVDKFIYTSTPTVVCYKSDIENGGRNIPYADQYPAPYPETKAKAEKLVLTMNGKGMSTVAIRPHLIFGPGDNLLLPRFLEGHLKGRLRPIGNGENLVDLTYIDNAAGAHLDALKRLTDGDNRCAGKAYVISGDEPVKLWHWFNDLCHEMDLPPVHGIRIPLLVAKGLFGVVEWTSATFGLGEPLVTGFIADALARHHWFDMTPAKRDLGYQVRVPMHETLAPTAAWLKTHVIRGGDPMGA